MDLRYRRDVVRTKDGRFWLSGTVRIAMIRALPIFRSQDLEERCSVGVPTGYYTGESEDKIRPHLSNPLWRRFRYPTIDRVRIVS